MPFPTLTVAELRKMLALMPLDMPVEVEGCDCTAPCVGLTATLVEGQLVAYLRREDGSRDFRGPVVIPEA